jgi:hypothetical protein
VLVSTLEVEMIQYWPVGQQPGVRESVIDAQDTDAEIGQVELESESARGHPP